MSITLTNQANGAGDDLTLAQDIYTGEVLTQFKEKTRIPDSLIVSKNIKNGKSASFKATGSVTAKMHTKGTIVEGGNEFRANEVIINVDNRIYAAEKEAEIDMLMNDYNARKYIAEEQAEALAYASDSLRFREMVLGCRSTTPNVVGGPVGSQITNADFASSDTAVKGAALAAALFEAAAILKEKKINSEIYAIFAPREYQALVQYTDAINTDFGGEGSIAKGTISMLNGIKIIESNSVERKDFTGDSLGHEVNTSNTYGIVFAKGLVAEVNLKMVQSKIEYLQASFETALISTSYIKGVKYLRPECGVELISE